MTDVDTTFSLSSNSEYVEALLDNIRGYLSLTDHEVGILRETNRILREPTPTTQLGLENRVSVLDQCRTDLVNLLYIFSASPIYALSSPVSSSTPNNIYTPVLSIFLSCFASFILLLGIL